MTDEPTGTRPVIALLDGHSLAFRAFFALPEDLATTTGQVTNAVYGFTSMLVKLLGDRELAGIAVAFDRGRPAQRLEILPDYKGHRPETPDLFRQQLPLISEVLEAFGIPQIVRDGVEADDLIATLATRATSQGYDTLIVTGDRDAFQLIDDHVTVLYTRRGISDTVLMDPAAVTGKYGVGPDQYPMLSALRGDPSDNIPGVPGVGEKTAAKLVTQFGSLEGVYENLDQVRGKKLLENLANHRDDVFAGYQVTQLIRDLDLEVGPSDLVMNPDADRIRQVFNTLEFTGLWDRMSAAVLDAAPAAEEPTGLEGELVRLDAGELATWLDRWSDTPVAVVVDSAGRPPDINATVFAVAAAGADSAAMVLDDATAEDIAALRALLSDPDRPVLVHDAKQLEHTARARGWTVAGVTMDTALAAYLVAPQARAYDLDTLAMQYLRKRLDVTEPAEDSGQLALAVSTDWRVRARQAQAVLELAGVLADELADREQGGLLEELEIPLVPVLVDMERHGITLDVTVLEEMSETLGDQLRDLREEIYGYAGDEFNLDSPKQLQAVLFDQLDLPKTKKIKTGYSTDAAALTSLIDAHPIIEPLQRYREISKLKHTYVDALPPLVNPSTGRIHAEFNQTVAVTGRLSSANPNIQNIPIRTEIGRVIRRAFVPGDGYSSLVVADYSQIELRVMAHLSGDPDLLAAFTSHEDVHATTAAMVWDLPIDAVDNTLRSRIKGMTYGLAYGLSAYGLSQQLGIPPSEARELMDAYFERFPKVGEYLQGVVQQARRDGWTSTLRGRRRYLPDLTSDNRQRRDMAERMALNAPIQGTAADLIKEAMVAVRGAMAAEGLSSQLLLQVHDELVCEAVPGEEDQLRELLVCEMSGVAELDVALEVDTATGESWYDAEKH